MRSWSSSSELLQTCWTFKDLLRTTSNVCSQVTQLLIEHGAEVNSVNSHKLIPLHLAAQNGHLELSKMLIDAGSKLDSADLIGKTSRRLTTSTLDRNNQIFFFPNTTFSRDDIALQSLLYCKCFCVPEFFKNGHRLLSDQTVFILMPDLEMNPLSGHFCFYIM